MEDNPPEVLPFNFPSDPPGQEGEFGNLDSIGDDPAPPGGTEIHFPFRIYKSETDGSVRIETGQVAGITPSSIGGEKAIPSGTTRYLYLAVTYDKDSTQDLVSSVSFNVGTSVPTNTATVQYIQVGVVTNTSGEISEIQQSLSNSLGFAYCQGSVYYWGI